LETAVATRKKKNLVIVESPAKAKTINKYLGDDFEVVASKGHVRDLPKSRFGIDIENGWIPTYRPLKDRKDVLDSLKKQAAKCGLVYLAPDPDREGEAIAWHLKEALGLSDERTRRVTFNEITKTAIKKAFEGAGHIDMDRVAAQEARRFLDRVVGYKLSPLLSRRLTETLSAGRVQSVAVRLIVEREREIQNFKPEEFWKIAAIVRPQGAHPRAVSQKPIVTKAKSKTDAKKPETAEPLPEGAFVTELAEWAGEKFKATNQEQADAIVKALEGAAYVVSKVEQKDRQEKAAPPFTTSTLQQQASIRLRYTAKRTMMNAQKLYQGVEIAGEGSVALITYMRTDSTRISPEALTGCRTHIKGTYGERYLPEKPNIYSSGKGAQDAHEAIRPTDLTYTPERVAKALPQDLAKLYTLIYNRFVASQMNPAIFAITNVDVSAAKGIFKAQGKIMKFDGYRKVLAPTSKQEDALLPALSERQKLDLLKLNASQHFTEPPSRFNEASLVKTLEKEGIGRPSTYATIITKIQERNYVELKERRFYATKLGMTVTDLLVEHFPTVMDLKFTSRMEEELDDIETRKYQRNDVLNEFYQPFALALQEAEGKMAGDAEKCPECGKPLVEKFSRFGKFFGCSGHPDCKYIKRGSGPATPREPPKPTDIVCPNCGKPMVQRMSRRGPFLGCSGYPDCKTTMNLDAAGKPTVTAKPTDHVCDQCGKPMVLREGPRGPFLACTGYPKCRRAMDVDAKGNPIKPIETGITCEKCGAAMAVKRGPRGPFLGCTAYPKCRSTKQIPPELKDKLKDLMPAARKKPPKVEVSETCPECGSAMEVRQGRKGYFLGCTMYAKTKCKGTREVSPEILDRLQAEDGAA
jgi:DNA topoisomerase-1